MVVNKASRALALVATVRAPRGVRLNEGKIHTGVIYATLLSGRKEAVKLT